MEQNIDVLNKKIKSRNAILIILVLVIICFISYCLIQLYKQEIVSKEKKVQEKYYNLGANNTLNYLASNGLIVYYNQNNNISFISMQNYSSIIEQNIIEGIFKNKVYPGYNEQTNNFQLITLDEACKLYVVN